VIIEYHRPEALEEALKLLARKAPFTRPVGGGSYLSRPLPESFAVVDIGKLGLDKIASRGSHLVIGAAVTLQALYDYCETNPLPFSPALRRAIEHDSNYNQRQVATTAGALVSSDGRSAFAVAVLALDAQLTLLPVDETISLGDLLPLREERLRGRLITEVHLPLRAVLAYEYVARTPADLPLVCGALARWPSGRTRLALGGWGKAALLAMDGPEAEGVEPAAFDAFSAAGDEWASAEYRQNAAKILAGRCLASLEI
jgi:CO/xanthine dehydrogenase FAD-binding subunit